MKNQEREPSSVHHLLEPMFSFKNLLITTFQVLGLTGALLVSLAIYLATPTLFLLPPLISFRHCSTFLKVSVIFQCLIHLVHFAIHIEACLSGRRQPLSWWFRRLEIAFAITFNSTITLLLARGVMVTPEPLEELHGVLPPLTFSNAMVQAAADRCLLRSGVCKDLRSRPDYLSVFSYATNQSLLTPLERSCCGPPSRCDPCCTKSSGTLHPMAQIARASSGMPRAGPLCEARDLHMKDDPGNAGCHNCKPCYEAYADGLKKGWIVTAIYSVYLVKFTGWIDEVAYGLWVRN